MGCGTKVVEANAAQEVTVGNGGHREEAVITSNQVAVREHTIEVVPRRNGGSTLLGVTGPEATLDLTTESLEGGGGNDAFWRSADTEENVGATGGPGRGDSGVGG